jgi:integrase
MHKWCDMAGLSACSAHSLRRVCARRLAEAGATAHAIMAANGHKTLADMRRDTAAEREARADSAHKRLPRRPQQEHTEPNTPGTFTAAPGQSIVNKGNSDGVR